jgi:hypothetical protein
MFADPEKDFAECMTPHYIVRGQPATDEQIAVMKRRDEARQKYSAARAAVPERPGEGTPDPLGGAWTPETLPRDRGLIEGRIQRERDRAASLLPTDPEIFDWLERALRVFTAAEEVMEAERMPLWELKWWQLVAANRELRDG